MKMNFLTRYTSAKLTAPKLVYKCLLNIRNT